MRILYFQSALLKTLVVEDLHTTVQNMLRKVMKDETAEKYSLTGRSMKTADPSSSATKLSLQKTPFFKLLDGKTN